MRQLSIPVRWLYAVHIIAPVVILVVVIDWLFLDQTWQPYLQWSLTTLTLYLLVFELPHIIASFFSYADTEYLGYYKMRLALVPVIIGSALLLFMYAFLLMYLLYSVLTMYHVTKQQTGITALLLKEQSVLHVLWSWLLVAMYTCVMASAYEAVSSEHFWWLENLKTLYILLGFWAIITALYAAHLYGKRRAGVRYFALTSGVALTVALCLIMGYSFLAILAVRFVHDVTAFMFYISHDANRNSEKTHNFFYRYLAPIGLPLLIITPVSAIVLAAIFRWSIESLSIGILLIMTIGIVHYYLESFMWKHNSLHRQHIKISY